MRTFASVIHGEDREQVERSVMDGVRARRPFTLEYRIVRRDGAVRWVLERGRLQEAEDGRRWLDGAIFDVTVRRAAEQALHEREIAEAQLAEVRASRARILEAADSARREIERNLHDGAQQRLVAVALRLQLWLAAHRELSAAAHDELGGVLSELRAGLAELRDRAHGLHPAVLSESGLEHALASLASRASLPVELQIELRPQRLPMPIEAAAYFTVCEALTNVIKYAHATRAWVSVVGDTGHLPRSRTTASAVPSSAPARACKACATASAVNGTLDIDSRPETGTLVRASVPVAD